MNNKVILIIAVAIVSMTMTSVYGSEDSPYESGYDRGCDDADKPASERYINEPGKGPRYHRQIYEWIP